ncbi:MAG TPA: L,D-transpeptidase family protein [Longimicrobiaceae bacterium]
MNRSVSLRALGAAALLGALAGCSAFGSGPEPAPAPVEAVNPGETIRRDAKYVVIDLDANQLRFMDGDRVLWAAPVGTGTGFRLTTPGQQWSFSTPQGMMHVQYKELNPVWVAPDWYFIENKLPVPPANSPRRRQPGGLGAAAVYLGNEIAIHGTDKPELLGQRVSHGCIRLSNANAVRLFHNVQIGTPILIQGGPEEVAQEQPDSVARFTQRKRTAAAVRPANPFAGIATPRLLTRLGQQLKAEADTSARWAATASELIQRGLKDDAVALRGVLALAGSSGNEARDAEYATFLADVFSRGTLRTVVSLNRIEDEARQAAARAIVEATMGLYHGSLSDRLTPWPTRRVHKERLGPEGQKGWAAIAAAEQEYRERRGAPAAGAGAGR